MVSNLQDVRLSDGCTVKVKILGDDPSKPLMIAHHGAPGIATHKEPEASYSAFQDIFRILVFDMRGSGNSDKTRPYTHERWVKDVDELRQWAGADKFVLTGGSHGGFITLDYAVAYPQYLYGIMVGDSAACMAGWASINMTKVAITDSRVKTDPDQIVRMFSGQMTNQNDLLTGFVSIAPLYAAPDELKAQAEVNVDEVLSQTVVPFWETCNAAMKSLSHYDVRESLKGVKVPAFVYVGRHDWITPPSLSEEIAEKMPHAKFVIYEKSGHLAALEEKTAFQRDAREFIATLGIPGLNA